jgi:4-hydroxy-tetrahydrodipicolinate synthase
VTPFKNGALDESAFRALVAFQIQSGSAGVVVAGTSGEAWTLSPDERSRLIAVAADEAAGRIRIIAGTGAPATADAIALTRAAEAAGANAALVLAPAYAKPSRRELLAHYKSIHDSTGLSLLLYDFPSRAGIELEVPLIAELSGLPRIAGAKLSGKDIGKAVEIRGLARPGFKLYGGHDLAMAGFLAQGGDGLISMTGNVAPGDCAALCAAWDDGRLADFAGARDRLAQLTAALVLDSSPGPAKHALALMGLCGPELRPPLLAPRAETRQALATALKDLGLTR